jgi:alpha-galactosidase
VAGALRVQLASPSAAVRRLRLRWNARLDDVRQILGDAWERGYGDLEWRAFVPDRVMPWYVALSDGRVTHAYGVRTGAHALCFWQIDPRGLSLWTDVRSGGAGVELGARTLAVCDIVPRQGRTANPRSRRCTRSASRCARCAKIPAQPVYGSNDWYWAYGKNSAATVLADAQHIVELSPTGANRPFAVIDDGWQPERGPSAGARDDGPMGSRERQVPGHGRSWPGRSAVTARRPGIWIRPLLAPSDAPDSWRLPRDRAIPRSDVDATRAKVTATSRACGNGATNSSSTITRRSTFSAVGDRRWATR